jgi:hypothetical protein
MYRFAGEQFRRTHRTEFIPGWTLPVTWVPEQGGEVPKEGQFRATCVLYEDRKEDQRESRKEDTGGEAHEMEGERSSGRAMPKGMLKLRQQLLEQYTLLAVPCGDGCDHHHLEPPSVNGNAPVVDYDDINVFY